MIYSSDQEVDQPEQEHSFGVGRLYECVFCRRGFNTAQALGGHMNIHRKDRARNNKPTTMNTAATIDDKLHEENFYYTDRRRYFYLQQQIPGCSAHLAVAAPDHDHHQEEAVQLSYRTYNNFLASSASSSSGAAPFFYGNHHNPFGEDGRPRQLSLPPFGSSGLAEEISKSRRGGIQQEELDLELRLWWKWIVFIYIYIHMFIPGFLYDYQILNRWVSCKKKAQKFVLIWLDLELKG